MSIKLKENSLELFITDPHYPTDDPAVTSLELQVARALKPDILWLNGDNVDLSCVSRFRQNPRDRLSLREDLAVARKRLEAFRQAIPNAQIVLKEGNHDLRIQHYLWDVADRLAELDELQLPALLQLDKLGARWSPNLEKSRVGELWHLHGNEVRTGMAYPAKAMLARVNDNVIFGHVHRFSVAHVRSLAGSVKVAWSIGCTQQLEVEYDFHPQWSQGFALVELTKRGLFHVNPVEIFRDNGKTCCMVYGKLYTA